MTTLSSTKGRGWYRDLPDFRDQTPATKTVTEKQKLRGVTKPVNTILKPLEKEKANPVKMDLRHWCSAIEDQGQLNSCTANAAVGLYEYFERRAFGKHIEGSRLFLYKATRNLLQWEGDEGAYLRTAMGAMALFGVPPEKYWPYNEAKVNIEPDAFLYSFAKNFQAITYYRLDPPGMTRVDLLNKVKEHLSMNLPLLFGFSCYSSLGQSDDNGGCIPFPDKLEDQDGGHAVMAIGFDDKKIVTNKSNGEKTKGAILIRNSWGKTWGEEGYGWLPYEYVLKGIADDWWAMTKAAWIDTGNFGE